MNVVPTPHTLDLAARMVAAARHEPGADVALAMLPEYKDGQGVALVGAILAQVARVAALPHDSEPSPGAGPAGDVDADCQEIVERACRAWGLTEEMTEIEARAVLARVDEINAVERVEEVTP